MMDRHRDRDRDREFRDRDRDRDFRDRDFRDRDRDRRRPSRFSDAPPPDNRRSPSSFRVPLNRSFDSPPPRQPERGPFRPPPNDAGGSFRPPPGDGGGPFRPPSGDGGGPFRPPPGDGGGPFLPPHDDGGGSYRPPHGGDSGGPFQPPHGDGGGPFHPPHGDGGGFRPPSGGGPPGGFWPMGGGGGFGNEFMGPPRPMMPPQPQLQPQVQPPSLSGQKRGYPSSGRGGSPDQFDGKSFVKLFVGSVPRTVTEEEVRPLFEEQGKVLEVALIKDKRTGQQQGCCFIKYATSEEADRAIRALHNQYTLPGGVAPIQVRYADGERERLGNGAVEYKLFVGSLNKLAPEKEVEEIFAPYGRIEDVYLMRDERKQSRGCGFVKFSNKESAMAAINALNGIYTMRGCDQPLIVRFADPKRPRAGEPRAGSASGGPGFAPTPPVIRPASAPNFPGPIGGQGPPNAWQPMSPQNRGPSPNVGAHGFGNNYPPRSGDTAISSTLGAHLGPQGSLTEGSVGGTVSANSTSPQNFNRSFPQVPPNGQQISPLQKPLESPQHFPPSLQLHQGPGMYSQAPTSQASVRPLNSQSSAQASYSQPFQPQQLHGSTGQVPPAQFYVQHSATTPGGLQQRPNAASLTNSQLPTSASQQPPPYQQPPSQITQMLSQQTQNLQASFQSSQHAISQLQQQVQLMQPSMQNESLNQSLQQNFQASRQQSQWGSAVPTTSVSGPALAPPTESPSMPSLPAGSAAAARPAPLKCNWTEHTSPDGYKYYYNSVTGESRWLKPEELASYEQQQQKSAVQQPPSQPSLHAVPNQQVTQTKAPQFQTQFRHTEQLQNPSLSSMYQAPRGMGSMTSQEATYPQFQAPPNNSVNDLARFQQGAQAAQDWSWKSNSGGT